MKSRRHVPENQLFLVGARSMRVPSNSSPPILPRQFRRQIAPPPRLFGLGLSLPIKPPPLKNGRLARLGGRPANPEARDGAVSDANERYDGSRACSEGKRSRPLTKTGRLCYVPGLLRDLYLWCLDNRTRWIVTLVQLWDRPPGWRGCIGPAAGCSLRSAHHSGFIKNGRKGRSGL